MRYGYSAHAESEINDRGVISTLSQRLLIIGLGKGDFKWAKTQTRPKLCGGGWEIQVRLAATASDNSLTLASWPSVSRPRGLGCARFACRYTTQSRPARSALTDCWPRFEVDNAKAGSHAQSFYRMDVGASVCFDFRTQPFGDFQGSFLIVNLLSNTAFLIIMISFPPGSVMV